MSIIKKFFTLFSCKSSCAFNNQEFDINLNDMKLGEFKLKNKDILLIHKILSKRKKIRNIKEITEV
tara:strand:- start:1660 stop:1857 length:198 start_codon:yes stop_codon:yes gene_type:complete